MVNSILILKSDPTFQYKNSIISALQDIDYRMSQFEDVMDIDLEVTPRQSPVSPLFPVRPPPPPKKGRKRRRKQKGRGESKIITVS